MTGNQRNPIIVVTSAMFVCLAGCADGSMTVSESVSATDGPEDLTGTDTGGTSAGGTSGGEQPPICKGAPDPVENIGSGFGTYICNGSFKASLRFEHVGGLNASELVPICIDFEEVPGSGFESPYEDYESTCIVNNSGSFGPGVIDDNSPDVFACCQEDASDVAFYQSCAQDFAYEGCILLNNKFAEAIDDLPLWAKGSSIANQMADLNAYMASVDGQNECFDAIKELQDNDGDPDEAFWEIGSTIVDGDEFNPDTDWPDIKDPVVAVRKQDAFGTSDFNLNGWEYVAEGCGLFGDEVPFDEFFGTITGGNAKFSGQAGDNESTISTGEFAFSIADCPSGNCLTQFTKLDLELDDFQLGFFGFGDVHASLIESVDEGVIHDGMISVAPYEMSFLVLAKVSFLGQELLGGMPIPFYATNSTAAVSAFDMDSGMFEVKNIGFRLGGVNASVRVDPSPCD